MLIETDYRALLSAGQGGMPPVVTGGVVVIGNFDGVHLGHQALLAQAKKLSNSNGIPLVVLTFNPHPRHYFAPNQPSFLIAMPAQKNEMLHQCGVDSVVSLKFDSMLANATAEEFVQSILVTALRAHTVIVGDNFVFGKERGGDVDFLRKCGDMFGFAVTTLPIQTDHESSARISSERVRDALKRGDVSEVTVLLGRPWQIKGYVIHGHKRGRTIGFPTANLSLGDYVHPAMGAYAAQVTIEGDDTLYPAIVNIGKRPTIGEFNPILEAHLLDFTGDLYDKELRINLVGFVRPERKFTDVEALKHQIAQDVEEAKALLRLL